MSSNYQQKKMMNARGAIDTKGNIVLEQFQDGTALLFQPGNVQPFCVATDYDRATASWSYGKYFSDLGCAHEAADPEIIEDASVRWVKEDIREKLKAQDIAPTEFNVQSVIMGDSRLWERPLDREFRDNMIASGNDDLDARVTILKENGNFKNVDTAIPVTSLEELEQYRSDRLTDKVTSLKDKEGFRAAKRAAIKDSELEDVDNLYQEAKGLSKAAVSSTKGAVSNTRKSWKMLKRSTARIKALSRKRFTAGAGNKFNQQMYRYMRSAAYQSVSTGGGIINTAKNVLSYAYWSVRMAANGIGAILSALFGAIGVLIIPVIIIIAVICTISGGSKGENASVGSLTGDEATIAQYLIDKGVDRTHIAAIMGNMFQESGCHPTALNSSSGAYGICQWLGGRKTGLENLAKEKGKRLRYVPRLLHQH